MAAAVTVLQLQLASTAAQPPPSPVLPHPTPTHILPCAHHHCPPTAQVVVGTKTLAAVDAARAKGRPLWRVSSTVFAHVASDAVLRPLGAFADQPRAAEAYPPTSAGLQARLSVCVCECVNLFLCVWAHVYVCVCVPAPLCIIDCVALPASACVGDANSTKRHPLHPLCAQTHSTHSPLSPHDPAGEA